MSLDAMKQALEVLRIELPIGSHIELKNALRAAIEQTHGDWDEVEALRASLREHMAEIQRLRDAIEQAQEPETELETYKRLYELRGKALERPCSNCGHQPAKIKAMAQPEQEPTVKQSLTVQPEQEPGECLK